MHKDTPTPRFRFGYDPANFDPGQRIVANERLTEMQFAALGMRLDRIEEAMMRLERRLWLAVYGVMATIIAQAFQSVITVTP